MDGLKDWNTGAMTLPVSRCSAEGITRRVPALTALEALLVEPLDGTTGIGHTRWATHGIPNKANAHRILTVASPWFTTALLRTLTSCVPNFLSRHSL